MGWGLFAGPDGVQTGTVLPYTGRRVCNAPNDSAYLMQCGKKGLIDAADPNGRIVWENGELSDPVGTLLPCDRVGVDYCGKNASIARFVNHGIPPNVRLAGGAYKVLRDLAPGEQLLTNYGRSYWKRKGLLGERVRVGRGAEQTYDGVVVRRLSDERWRVRHDGGKSTSEILGATDPSWRLLGRGGNSKARMVWDGKALRRAVKSRGLWRFQVDGKPVPKGLRWRPEIQSATHIQS